MILSKDPKAERLDRLADAGRGLLVGAATVLPRCYRADAARIGAGASLLSIKVLTKVLKKLIPERRPNGENEQSFPSAHAAECVAAAMVINREYKREIGGAAYVLAAGIALARIASRKHHIWDVVAGAGIGALSVWAGLRVRVALERRVVGRG
jgi:membrane-associated phospholipid phosphatase